MSSQTTILPNATVCKDKTCPVCGKSAVLLDGEPGFATYSCGNPECAVKNCAEPWFLHLSSGKNLGELLMLAAEYDGLSELGKRHDKTEIGRTKLCAERIMIFHSEIENGVLQRMDDMGYQCSNLGENVLGSIGLSNTNRKLESALEFMYFDGNGVSVAETCTKKYRPVSENPGSFPIKTSRIEPVIYVFPSPKEVLAARSLWKNAGLGEFPAYAFTAFPLPATFCKTKKIVFVNVNGKMTPADILASAMKFHREGITISGRIRMNIDGLRSIFVEDPDAVLSTKIQSATKLLLAGKTRKDEDIYFSKHGYMVMEPGYSMPIRKTNFSVFPTRTIVSNYPTTKKITTADVYVDGKLETSGVVVPADKLNSMTKIRMLVDSLVPRKKLAAELGAFKKAKLDMPALKQDSFPMVPCIDRAGDVVFPGFRLCKEGFSPHAEMEKIMLGIRENLDYWALKPEYGTKQDLADFARLFLRTTDSHKAAVLGICAWLHSAVSGLVEMLHSVQFPKLCFEVHCKSGETPPSMSFLSMLFSGNPEPGNNLEYRKCYRAKHIYSSSTGSGTLFEPLPGVFRIDAKNPSKSISTMYYKTSSPGLYAVVNSDMSYPVNAHGNIQCAVSDCGTEELDENMPGIRRALLHILWKYVQTAEKINPDKWMTKRPELSMYNLVSVALKEFGITLPGTERFDSLYLSKK